jgi:hypothetical protein
MTHDDFTRLSLGRHTEMTLRAVSADPFVQAAVWRLYCEARELLTATVAAKIDDAQRKDTRD